MAAEYTPHSELLPAALNLARELVEEIPEEELPISGLLLLSRALLELEIELARSSNLANDHARERGRLVEQLESAQAALREIADTERHKRGGSLHHQKDWRMPYEIARAALAVLNPASRRGA